MDYDWEGFNCREPPKQTFLLQARALSSPGTYDIKAFFDASPGHEASDYKLYGYPPGSDYIVSVLDSANQILLAVPAVSAILCFQALAVKALERDSSDRVSFCECKLIGCVNN